MDEKGGVFAINASGEYPHRDTFADTQSTGQPGSARHWNNTTGLASTTWAIDCNAVKCARSASARRRFCPRQIKPIPAAPAASRRTTMTMVMAARSRSGPYSSACAVEATSAQGESAMGMKAATTGTP
jgi:hypothetical protein